MKKYTGIALLVLLAFNIILSLGGLQAIWNFLLVGAIPGTNANIPSALMLLLYIAAGWLIFLHGPVTDKLSSLLHDSNRIKQFFAKS